MSLKKIGGEEYAPKPVDIQDDSVQYDVPPEVLDLVNAEVAATVAGLEKQLKNNPQDLVTALVLEAPNGEAVHGFMYESWRLDESRRQLAELGFATLENE